MNTRTLLVCLIVLGAALIGCNTLEDLDPSDAQNDSLEDGDSMMDLAVDSEDISADGEDAEDAEDLGDSDDTPEVEDTEDVEDTLDMADVSACMPACETDTTCCDAACVDTETDSGHCGGCGVTCGDAQICDAGACVCDALTLVDATPDWSGVVGAPVTTDLTLTFSCPVDAMTLASVFVHAERSGRVEGTWSLSAETATFSPTDDLPAGAWIEVTVPASVLADDAAAAPLEAPLTWRFQTAVAGCTGRLEAGVSATIMSAENTSAALGWLDGDDRIDLVVTRLSANHEVWLGDESALFTKSTQTLGDVSSRTRRVVLADIDGDSYLDALFAQPLSDATAFLNSGVAGVLVTTGQSLADGRRGVDLDLGDLDADGDLDLLLAMDRDPMTSMGGGSLLFTNDGDGSFTNAGVALGAVDSSHIDVEIADLDNDGDLDAVFAGADGLQIFFNEDGVLTDGLQAFGLSDLSDVSLGDVDEDGLLDLLVVSSTVESELWRSLNGNVFERVLTTSFPQAATHDSELADLDGDGHLDALFANNGEPSTLWWGDGTGAFTKARVDFPTAPAVEVEVGDLEGDGDLDVYLVTDTEDLVFINEPRRAATSHTPLTHEGDVDAQSTVVIDFQCDVDAATLDDDGVEVWGVLSGPIDATFANLSSSQIEITPSAPLTPGDVITVNLSSAAYGVSGVPLEPRQWTFTVDVPGPMGMAFTPQLTDSGIRIGGSPIADARGLALADFDGDGDLDVWMANLTEPNQVFLNQRIPMGTLSFATGQQIGATMGSWTPIVGDLDDDGDLDVYETLTGVWLNDGSGDFTSTGAVSPSGNPRDAAAGDVDGDGDLDLIIVKQSAPKELWLNDGMANFTLSSQDFDVNPTNDSRGVSFGDVDNDDDLDILFTHGSVPSRVWLNDGFGSFSQGAQVCSSGEGKVGLGDLNGDRVLDVYCPSDPGRDEVWLGLGDGTFQDTMQTNLSGGNNSRAYMADVDADGDLDVIFYQRGSTTGGWRLWTNDGAGNLTDTMMPIDAPEGTGGSIVQWGDLDLDGDLDLVVQREDSDNTGCEIWLNQQM